MSATSKLLHQIQSAGLEIKVDGNRLVITPWSQVSDEMRAAIAENKADLITQIEKRNPKDFLRGTNQGFSVFFRGQKYPAFAEQVIRQLFLPLWPGAQMVMGKDGAFKVVGLRATRDDLDLIAGLGRWLMVINSSIKPSPSLTAGDFQGGIGTENASPPGEII